jgi:RNA polymerase sigma-70 factor (ECF subfamily)
MRGGSELEDVRLLELAHRGSEAAWTELFRRHQGPVFRYLLQMTGLRGIAEELTQEAFLLLLAEPSRFRPERGALRPWLIGVARNKLLRFQERERRWEALDDDLPAPDGPEQAAEREQVLRAVRALPPLYREAVVLCEFEGMEYAEAAKVLDCPVGTVRSRLHRARQMLLEALAPVDRGKGCLR